MKISSFCRRRAVLFSALAFSFSLPAFAAPARPNILIILADDLGWGEMSCQGNPQVSTPHIDALARNGVRFTNGYVSGTYCSPTRAALMTGRYQQRFGHEFNPGNENLRPENFGLSLQEKTIGDRLKAAGYATGWFGKSHLGWKPEFHPLRRGFDEYFGFLGGQHDYLDAASDADNPILRGTDRVDKIGYTTEDFAREAVAFMERHRAQPWLLYLAFNAVHAPLQATEKYLSRFSSIADKKRRTFAAMLSAMDDAVGTVSAKLRELGLEMAIRMGDWKLVKSVGSVGVEGPESHARANPDNAELYNLAKDIGEKENLAAREPAKAKELADVWNKWSAEMAEPSWFANRGPGKR